MDLSLPEYVIKKGRPHGHRYGKKPGHNEYYTANQLKKKCKKKEYQGIHDRFLRDHAFRERMIENNWDEEVCRTWDVLADQDHTYHLSEEEYFYYKNKWWLHLNKSGSDTLPLRKRSDFKQALSTLERLHQESGGEQLGPKEWRPASSSFSTWWEWQDSWWSSKKIRKSRKWQAKSWERSGRPVVYSTLAKTSEDGFQEFICFVTDRSFTADGGLLQPTGGVKTTPQRTRFRDVQYARIMATVWVDDDIKKKTWNCVCVVKPNGETSDTNDDVKTKINTKHMKLYTWHECAHSILVSSCSVCVVKLTHCSPHRVAQDVRVFVSFHPCMKWASLFDFELSIPSNFLLSFFIKLKQLLLPLTSTRLSSNTVYTANKEMGSTDESFSNTGYEPKRRLMSSPWPSMFVSTLYHEMPSQLIRKVGFKETPKLDPYWKSQPVTYKGNTEWKSELNLWTTTILTRGSDFLMAWTNWSRT